MTRRPLEYDNSGQAFAADIEAILAKGTEITTTEEPTHHKTIDTKRRQRKQCSGSGS